MLEKIEKIFLLFRKIHLVDRFRIKNKFEKVMLIVLFILALVLLLKLLNIISFDIILKYMENNILWLILFLFVLFIIYILLNSGRVNYEIKTCNFKEENTSDDNHNIYKCIIENISNKDIFLKGIIVEYKYYRGTLCSISSYEKMNYDEKYLIYLDIDACDYSIKQSEIIFDNEILLRKKNDDNTNYFDFELNLVYRMINLEYHPCYDWNIILNIYLVDTYDKKYEVICNNTWKKFTGDNHDLKYLISHFKRK